MSAILLRKLYKQAETVKSSTTDPNTLVEDELPLWNSLSESTRVSLKNGLAASSLVISFIQSLDSSSHRDRLQDFSTVVLNGGNEAKAQKALVLLMKLAETEPGFFTRELALLMVGSMLQIAETENLEEGTRHLAIEFVFTLAEARELTPEIMRKLPEFISRLFAILMRMLLDIEDEAAWHSAENDEDEDTGESSNYSIGQECLHRLAAVLGGNAVVRVAHEQLSAYLAASDLEWQKHLAALVALAQIAKGRSKVKGGLQYTVITMVMNAFQNPRHPRVRWAAIHAIGKLATHVGPSWQDFFKNLELTTLCLAQDDIRNPRVQETENNFDQLWLDLFHDSHHPSVRVVAINAIGQFFINLDQNSQFQYHSRVLPALAEAIYEDPDLRVRLAAIEATYELSFNLDPNSLFQYDSHVLPALSAAIYEDQLVRLNAINAIFRLLTYLDPNLPLPDLYGSYVLPALHVAICDFKDFVVQDDAAFAMIKISKNYPLDTPRYLLVTVGTLLELRHREDIASDQTRISDIRYILKDFEAWLPHETWTLTFNRLHRDQQAEVRSILEHGI